MEAVTSSTVEGRPFHVDIPDGALDDPRRRIAATNWSEKETVADLVGLGSFRDSERLGRRGRQRRDNPRAPLPADRYSIGVAWPAH
jgi:hypothetical protein